MKEWMKEGMKEIEGRKERRKMFSGMKRFEKSETFLEGEESRNLLLSSSISSLNFLLPHLRFLPFVIILTHLFFKDKFSLM